MGRKPQLKEEHREEVVFEVCHRFLNLGEKAEVITRKIAENWGVRLSRESIYPLIREGISRDYLLLSPPAHQVLAQRLADRFDSEVGRIHVVAVRGPSANEHVSAVGGDVVLKLVEELGQKKNPVHLGLGAGWTTMRVARRLALRLRGNPPGPDLVLHALSSSFDVTDPLRTPVAFFERFEDVGVKVAYVGLFAAAAVSWKDYDAVKRLPGVKESFERAREIDIVVTSLASATHEHGTLNRFLRLGPATGLNDLRKRGWVGDVQYLPYSEHAPITVRSGIRAVTLFELSELVAMARTPGKYVVLVAPPCGKCGELKTEAVRPLLKAPDLRVWTYLVTDVSTAEELLRAPRA
jgi:DNA-binding transcriptional regulator LsrR (DeoR family)